MATTGKRRVGPNGFQENPCGRSSIGLTATLFGLALLAGWMFSGGVSLGSAQEGKPIAQPQWSAEQLEFFEAKIRPVLVEKCYQCHSEDAKQLGGGLRVDTRAGLLEGGDSGAAIEPGKPRDSLLLLALKYEDEDYAMPPKSAGGKLPDNVIADFEKWIRQGAADPREGAAWVPDSGAGEEAKQWWAFQPLKVSPAPAVQQAAWPTSDLDRFVLAKLEAAGMQPNPDAEPTTLFRRLSFDLVGLPPDPQAARQFANDWIAAGTPSLRRELLAREVDRLLATPQFGERWGRYWLDVARYSESTGKDFNTLYPLAWRYRDYVIDAFNADLPYDQFVRQQVAGDLLEADSAAEKSQHLVATGFLAIGPKSLNEQMPRQFVVDMADEQIDAVTQSVLGLTVSCARCHDHKFDPISQKDYTALLGIFLSTETRYGTAGAVGGRNAGELLLLPDAEAVSHLKPQSREEIERKKQRLEDLREEQREAFAERQRSRREGNSDTGINLLRIANQIATLEAELRSYNADGSVKALAMGVRDKPANRSGLSAAFTRARPPRARNAGFDTVSDSPLFIRGEVDRPSERIPRSIPAILPGLEAIEIPRNTSGRKELAGWLTDAHNPLTARVFVNRVWHWLFGQGLVTSVDNFGTTGATPSHPELLDYLADRFMQEGWSLKKLVRELVLSRTYGLSSEYREASFQLDPANALIWRHSPRRLDAEAIRDAMLAIGGKLELTRPEGSLVARAGDGPLGGPRFLTVSEDAIVKVNSNLRSVYLSVARNVEPEILAVFDFPDGSTVQGARQITNVPGQSLYMLNSDFANRTARNLVKRVIGEPAKGDVALKLDRDDVPEQLEELYWVALGRGPEKAEVAAAQKLLSRYRRNPITGWQSVARALVASAEFRGID
ncbi:MAG: DUF1553 domain-containing protein [Planctomycetota bacterium]|jgi:hypothetical protein